MFEKIRKVINNNDDVEEEYPEYEFLASCLRIGLTMSDLKKLTYVEVAKVMYSFLDKNSNNKGRKATQADIDKLLM